MRASSQSGFTLLEVIVALMVSAVVILGARALLDGLSLHAERVRSLARSADAVANADHVLRSVVLRAGLASDSAGRFDGTPERARFASWCDVAGGWQERCNAQLATVREVGGGGLMVVVELGDAGRVEVAQHLDAASFRYLESAADGGHWVERWEQAIVPPLAIGLITRTTSSARPDTTILRVGERN